MYTILLALLTLCLCGRVEAVDELSTAMIVKNALTLSDPVVAQTLKGGLSGARIFMVADADSHKYVIRFFGEKSSADELDREIACLKTASHEEYGPHVYFIDPKKEYVIMEYLEAQAISCEQRQSNALYSTLGQLLKKIHRGQVGNLEKYSPYSLFDCIKQEMMQVVPKNDGTLPLTKIESIVTLTQCMLTPYLTVVTSHNDLNPNNIMFVNNELKAIDYEAAGLADPYVDLATVAIFWCVFDPQHEKVLLSTYLGRDALPQEKAKLFLMKQTIRLLYALHLFKLSPDNEYRYNDVAVGSYYDFFKSFFEGAIDIENPENQIRLAKTLLNQAFAEVDSQEFRDACQVLCM